MIFLVQVSIGSMKIILPAITLILTKKIYLSKVNEIILSDTLHEKLSSASKERYRKYFTEFFYYFYRADL